MDVLVGAGAPMSSLADRRITLLVLTRPVGRIYLKQLERNGIAYISIAEHFPLCNVLQLTSSFLLKQYDVSQVNLVREPISEAAALVVAQSQLKTFVSKVNELKFQYAFPSIYYDSNYGHFTFFLQRSGDGDDAITSGFALGLDSELCLHSYFKSSQEYKVRVGLGIGGRENDATVRNLVAKGSIDRYYQVERQNAKHKPARQGFEDGSRQGEDVVNVSALASDLLSSEILEPRVPHPIFNVPKYVRSGLVACILLYDDVRFMKPILDYLLLSVERIVILLSSSPWHGPSRDVDHVEAMMLEYIRANGVQGRVTVIKDFWASETKQRNHANQVVKGLSAQDGVSYACLIVDGDEFWDVQSLGRIFKRVEIEGVSKYNQVVDDIVKEFPEGGDFEFGRCGYKYNWLRGDMVTYFGDVQSFVDPRENLKILFYVDQDCCEFVSHREIACLRDSEVKRNGEVVGALEGGGGIFIDESFGVCHHLSYVRTQQELVNKFSSFEHSDEIVPNWIAEKWDAWRSNNTLEDLHPTKPEAYKRTKRTGIGDLTVEMVNYIWESCYFPGDVEDDAKSIICGGSANVEEEEEEEEEVEHARSELVILEEPRLEATKTSNQVKAVVDGLPKAMTITNTGYIAEGESSISKHGGTRQMLTVVETNRIEEGDVTVLDVEGEGDFCGKPEFLIFILCEGVYDEATEPVFEEVANALQLAVTAVLTTKYGPYPASRPAVIVSKCPDLRFCKMKSERYVIMLGIHHMSRYTDEFGNVASVVGDFPKRDRTVLYNFEDAGNQVDFEKGRMKEVLSHYGENIWDYSAGNIGFLVDSGISKARYVPMGWVSDLYPEVAKEGEGGGVMATTDVLFYGRLNNYRAAVLEQLRSEGVNVRHVNANSEGVWGDELRREIDGAKIVLSLRYFKNQETRSHTEWKFTRFYYPLIRRTLVVSEPSGSQQEMDYWKGGLVFAQVEEMAQAIKFFLREEKAREEVTSEGRRLLERISMSESIEGGVLELIGRRCRVQGGNE
ncbi:hypothetical protein TrVE_jg4541 [Triparma verrucosa]|uniref:Uncharacterized protein n=1 Tax=Triparma verrucosa TaxID=1606542 RepID=A0A9W7BSZ6_9STRA|nr:hypothetical protein TrVE_jg4541 [Triparma verrucosa]